MLLYRGVWFMKFVLLLWLSRDTRAESNDCYLSLANCAQKTKAHVEEFVKCDMCCCEDLFDGNKCTTENQDIYNCFIKYTPKSNSSLPTLDCKVNIKTSWITGFIVISAFVCCCCFGIFGAIFWHPRDSTIKGISQRLVS
jgi:hypothetical protein